TKERPTFLESYDSEVFKRATTLGKSYNFLQETGSDVEAVLLIGFDDPNTRVRSKHIKKTGKLLQAGGAWHVSASGGEAEELLSLRQALAWTASPDKEEFSPAPLLGGAYIPPEGVSVFRAGLKTLAKKHDMKLPVFGQDLQNLYYVWPTINLKKSSDKQ